MDRVTELPDELPDVSGDDYPWDDAFQDDALKRRRPGPTWDPGPRGRRVLLVVAGFVVCLSAALVWFSRPHVTAAPAPAVSVAAAPASPAILIVSVAGKVNRPGLVRLPAGSRVADAIDAAGGIVAGTDVTGLNLARKVVDGEMIAVGVPPPVGAAPAGAGPGSGLINLNTASVADLQKLPGIGEVLAQRIVEFRDGHGGFRAVTDLRQVEGIGDAKFAQLKDKVTV
ncbi:helix-hairpin-helix domain-containing protein [Dactylosporangium sp. CS-047395]|uniref:helix-hairpin-helix domain-containing protein n=1 Tax=Dactylosporangium sp. CS-047395 TaxID=3239936 RepID=UPI003D914B0E